MSGSLASLAGSIFASQIDAEKSCTSAATAAL